MFNKIKNNKGFTLVELLTVVAIIAILAAVVVPNLFRAIEKSRVTAAVADYMGIKNAVLAYNSDTGEWPGDSPEGSGEGYNGDPGLVEVPEETSNVEGWNGPYLDAWPAKNPWGGTYTFIRDYELPDDGPKARCLCMDKVPAVAAGKLAEQLSGLVITDEDDSDSIYMIMFKE